MNWLERGTFQEANDDQFMYSGQDIESDVQSPQDKENSKVGPGLFCSRICGI